MCVCATCVENFDKNDNNLKKYLNQIANSRPYSGNQVAKKNGDA